MKKRKENEYIRSSINVEISAVEKIFNSLTDENKNIIITQIFNYLDYGNNDLDKNLNVINCVNPKIDFKTLSEIYSKKNKEQLIFLLSLEFEMNQMIEEQKYIKYKERIWKKF